MAMKSLARGCGRLRFSEGTFGLVSAAVLLASATVSVVVADVYSCDMRTPLLFALYQHKILDIDFSQYFYVQPEG